MPTHSENQWALVWREFRRRRLAVLSAGLILLLITSSICAPFLSNDRPIYYRGYNRFEYQEALRTLRAVVGNLAEQEAAEGERSTAIENPAQIMDRQVRLMSAAVTDDTADELRALGDRLQQLARQDPDDPAAADELRALRLKLRQQFDARRVGFISRSYWPVLDTLNWLDLLFMTFNVLLLTAPVWRWGVRLVIPRSTPLARTRTFWGVLLVMPAVCSLLWYALVPERIDRTDYKTGVLNSPDQDIQRAPVVYDAVTWPLVPYGLDEDNLDAKNLMPTFWSDGQRAGEDPQPQTTAEFWGGPHWMGTDGIGRDVLSRMIWGGRVSLAVGVVAVSIYVTIGIIVGSIAGYFRGIADLLISRLIEIVICFPAFFLILTIVAFIGPSIFNIMIVIGAIGWTGVARLVRGEFLRLGEQEFVLAARALGYSPWRIIFRHVLPNAMAPVLVSATFGIAGAILTESALSFLGFGITVPKPSWGGILATGRDAIFRAPWLIYFPGLAIFVTITAYNLVGEALRDAADPRLRGQHVP